MIADVQAVLSGRRGTVILSLAIFFLALGLRLLGIGWGLANGLHLQSLHPDEPLISELYVAKAPMPVAYSYGSLYPSIVRLGETVAGFYGNHKDPLLIQGDRPGAFEGHLQYLSFVHLVGRIVSALAGAGTAVILFLIGRRFFGKIGGLIAAAVVAVAPAFVIHSRFQTTDAFATFLLACSVFFALRLLDTDESKKMLRTAVFSGMFAGLSAGTKYTGAVVLICLYAVLALRRRPESLRMGAIATGAAVLAFLVATPGAVLEPARFVRDFRYEMGHTSTGHGLVFVGTSPGYIFHLGNLFEGIGPLVTLLGLGGLVAAAIRRKSWAIAVLTFTLPYYLLVGGAEVKFLRYTFPLYVGIALGLGWLVVAAHRRGGYWRMVVVLAILGLGGFESRLVGLRGAVTATSWMLGPDPRDQAGEYLIAKARARAGTTVGIFKTPWYYTASLYPLANLSNIYGEQTRMKALSRSSDPKVSIYAPGAHPDYMVVSSMEVGDELRLQGAKGLPGDVQVQVDRVTSLINSLREGYVQERSFGNVQPPVRLPHDIEYVQPWVQVWRRMDLPES